MENSDSNTDAPSNRKDTSPALMPEKEYMNYPAFKELAARPQWVNWSPTPRTSKDGITKIAKPPYEPGSRAKADTCDPATWGTYQQALKAVKSGLHTGIGYVFSEDDPYTGIDLDTCRNPETGLIRPWALRIIDRFNSYTEVSPSGTGVHIYVKGKLPGTARRRQAGEKMKVEAYPSHQYFTFTGDHLPGTPLAIEPRQEQLDELALWLSPPAATTPAKSPRPATTQNGRDHTGGGMRRTPAQCGNQELLDWARKKSANFRQLYDLGDISGYPSPSEAVMALCRHLLYWTMDKHHPQGDPARADKLFRDSALMGTHKDISEKWDRNAGQGKTYGERTIEKAQGYLSQSHAVKLVGRSEGTERSR